MSTANTHLIIVLCIVIIILATNNAIHVGAQKNQEEKRKLEKEGWGEETEDTGRGEIRGYLRGIEEMDGEKGMGKQMIPEIKKKGGGIKGRSSTVDGDFALVRI